MTSATGKSSLLTRRWVWITAAVLGIFILGVMVGAGAQADDVCTALAVMSRG